MIDSITKNDYTLSVKDKEQEECFDIVTKFLNTCRSNPKSIDVKAYAYPAATRDYKIKTSAEAIDFILNKLTVIGICKKEKLGYNKENAPDVYEYVFNYKDEDDNIGCLAFHKNLKTREKIKWYIKSLHKDELCRIPSKDDDVFWLSKEQILLLERK